MKDFYCYPMVLLKQDDGYGVIFPDFNGCVSHGKDIEEAVKSGKEALSLHLYGMLEDNLDIPEPSDPKDIKEYESNQIVVFADINMKVFKHSFNNKSVTRAITLPKWMNEMVKDSDMNVSAIVQQSIKEYLGIKED